MIFKRKSYGAQNAPQCIIVGLGNPGTDYQTTRHNAGFLCVDALAERTGAKIKKLKFKALYGDCDIDGVRCILCKPQNFMNRSGETVRDIAAFYKIPLDRVIIIFDDVSLDVGRIRIRKGGSDGGHNGMGNIIYLTGDDQIPRIKIGVGGKPHPDADLADWVLSGFRAEEIPLTKDAISRACKAAALMASGEIDKAMNMYNQ